MGPLRRGPCSPVIHVTHLSLDFQEDPLEEETAPTPVFLPREFHGQRSLMGYSPQGHKESDTAEQLSTAHTSFSCSFAEDVHSINTDWASLCAEFPCTGDGTGTMTTVH